MFYPYKHSIENMYKDPEYKHVHSELKRVGVTLKLLWKEYCDKCNSEGTISIGYTKYCDGYGQHTVTNSLTNHLIHKLGIITEVDWSGPTMKIVDIATGEIIKVYLFVSTLPFSQYSYVEPCLGMKEDTWLKCHVHMYEFYGGITVRTVCGNLKTGVIKHPKEGDIILNDNYETLGSHYSTAIMPTGVRKPKHYLQNQRNHLISNDNSAVFKDNKISSNRKIPTDTVPYLSSFSVFELLYFHHSLLTLELL